MNIFPFARLRTGTEFLRSTGPLKVYECLKAFSETDFSEDLKKFNFPTLVGAPHGLTAMHQDKVNADLLALLKGAAKAAA